jgi:hypothetical protein
MMCPRSAIRRLNQFRGMLPIAVLCTTLPAARLSSADTAAGRARCPLCSPDLSVPVVPIKTAWLDSMARAHATFNARQIDHIDSLLQAGFYGSPDDPASRQAAHLVARLATINAYRDLVALACDSNHVYEASEAALRDLYTRYSDVNLFVAVRLKSVRIGMGHVCARYDLRKPAEGVSQHGGKPVRWRVRDVDIEGCERRVLDLEIPTAQNDEVEIYLASHHTCSVEYRRSDGPPAPFEWFQVRDIEGAWVRKWGTHRPTAYMFWVSEFPPLPNEGERYMVASADSRRSAAANMEVPSTPFVGLRIYFPDLKLELPLLPDINVDDLRELELPMPILDLEFLRRNGQPSWLEVNANLGFKNWEQYGPIPPEIRKRFPDK